MDPIAPYSLLLEWSLSLPVNFFIIFLHELSPCLNLLILFPCLGSILIFQNHFLIFTHIGTIFYSFLRIWVTICFYCIWRTPTSVCVVHIGDKLSQFLFVQQCHYFISFFFNLDFGRTALLFYRDLVNWFCLFSLPLWGCSFVVLCPPVLLIRSQWKWLCLSPLCKAPVLPDSRLSL